jgi:hypothetical protein
MASETPILDRLAKNFDVESQILVDVNVNWDAVRQYIIDQYSYLDEQMDEIVNVKNTITESEWLDLHESVLAKRVQWVNRKAGVSQGGRTIHVDPSLRLTQPLFELVYAFGAIESQLGVKFLPNLEGLAKQDPNPTVLRHYGELVTKLKNRYEFSNGLPAKVDGSWAYMILAEPDDRGVEPRSVTREPRPADVYLAAALNCALTVARYRDAYDVTFRRIITPATLRTAVFEAATKGEVIR